MLIDFKEIISKYSVNIKGIIQVGSHWAEEHDVYVELGVSNIVYIEPCEEAYLNMLSIIRNKTPNTIEDKFRLRGIDGNSVGSIKMFMTACGDIEGEAEMYVSHNNQGQSNSLLKPLLHLQQHPEVVFTDSEKVKVMPLDRVPFERNDYNILILDCQGFEGQILKGANETLKNIDLIYTECNNGQTYEGNMELNEMDKYLEQFSFNRTDTYFPSPNWTWGDCVYLRKELVR